VNPREAAVAREIRRLCREELRLELEARLSLVVAVEDRFRVILNEEDAATARSLADLARIVAGRTGEEIPA
jgi:hypothetical protein